MAQNDIRMSLWDNIHNANIIGFKTIMSALKENEVKSVINEYDPKFRSGWCFLHYATYLLYKNQADMDFVNFLLSYGADPSKPANNNNPLTPFQFAIGIFYLPAAVNAFLSQANGRYKTLLLSTALNNKLPLTFCLTNYAKLKHFGKENDLIKVVGHLVDHGIKIGEVYENYTPLMNAILLQATYNNLNGLIPNLLKNVTSENEAKKHLLYSSKLGYTPLHLIFLLNNEQNQLINIIQPYLVKFNINVYNALDKNNKNPYNWVSLARVV